MRSSGRPVLATSSAARLELAHEARLRRHDSRSDGSWDLSGLCRSAPDLQVSASGDAKGSAKRSSRNKARCMMMPDPTPPYHARHFCPDCREKVLPVIGWMAPAPESALSPAPPRIHHHARGHFARSGHQGRTLGAVSATDVEPAGAESVTVVNRRPDLRALQAGADDQRREKRCQPKQSARSCTPPAASGRTETGGPIS